MDKAFGAAGVALLFGIAHAAGLWAPLAALMLALFALCLLPRRRPEPLASEPRVSVIVPMRNEEENAAGCLDSLDALEYGNMEAIIIDDRSTDGTAGALRAWASARTPRKEFRFLTAPSAPPPGWIGKTFAIDSALPEATGELILVADADVRHSPESLRTSVAMLKEARADLLSRTPRIELSGPAQLHAAMAFFLLSFGSRLCELIGARQGFATGMYALFSKEAYLSTGGWKAARAFPETPALARLFRASGRTYAVRTDQSHEVSTPMYASLGESARGFVRNTNFRIMPLLPFLAVCLAAGYAAYSASLLLSPDPAERIGGAAGLAIVSLAFFAHLIRSGHPAARAARGGVLAAPLLALILAIAALSALRHLLNPTLAWRGRPMPPPGR